MPKHQKKSLWNIYKARFNRPGRGIEKDEPKKTGLALFFEVLSEEWLELIKLNFLILIFCIPIFTIPAAFTASSKIMLCMFRRKTYYVFSDFFSSFLAEFVRATAVGFFYFAFAAALAFSMVSYFFLFAQSVVFVFLAALCIIVMILIFFVGFYLFPMVAATALKPMDYLKNSIFLAILCLKNNVLIALIVLLISIVSIVLFPYTVFFILLIVPAFIGFIITFFAYAGIKKYIVKDEAF